MLHYFLTLFILLYHLPKVQGVSYPATESYPQNFQHSRIQVYSVATTNIANVAYTFPFVNPYNFSSPAGTIALCTIDFIPDALQSFTCSMTGVSSAGMVVTCSVSSSSTLVKLIYSYIVFQNSADPAVVPSYLKRISVYSSYPGLPTTSSSISNSYPTTVLTNSKQLCYVFFRGITYSPAAGSTVINVSSNCYILKTSTTLSIYNSVNTSGGSFMGVTNLTIIYFDVTQNSIGYGIRATGQLLQYQNGVQLTTYALTYSTVNSAFLVGVKSFSSTNLVRLSFDMNYPTSIAPNSAYNSFQYVFFTKMTCSTTEFLDWATKTCKSDRGCTSYYQIITVQAAANEISVSKNLQMIAISQTYFISIYRYDGSTYVLFYKIYAPDSSQIVKFYFKEDYSRLIFIGSECGLYSYKWNGTNYVFDFAMPKDPTIGYTFIDLSASSDFKKLTVFYLISSASRFLALSFIFNNQKDTYQQALQTNFNGSRFMRIYYPRSQAYFVSSQYLYQATLESSGNFVLKGMRTYIYESSLEASTGITGVSLSGNGQVLAISYARSQSDYGVKIFQYSTTQQLFVFHSQIPLTDLSDLSAYGYVPKLSYDGLQLIEKGRYGQVPHLIVYSRPSLTSTFAVTEIIGPVLGLPYSPFTLSTGIDASDTFSVIASGDNGKRVVLYYCSSDIPWSGSVYTIPVPPALNDNSQSSTITPIENNTVNQVSSVLQPIKNSVTIIGSFIIVLLLALAGLLVYAIVLIKKSIMGAVPTASVNNSTIINSSSAKINPMQQSSKPKIKQEILEFSSLADLNQHIYPDKKQLKPDVSEKQSFNQQKSNQISEESKVKTQQGKRKKVKKMRNLVGRDESIQQTYQIEAQLS